MEGEIRVMGSLKNEIEKGRMNFKKSPKDRITESYIIARLEGLEEMINKFTKRHEHLIATYETENLDKSTYIKNDVFNEGYETYLLYKGELKTALKTFKPSTSTDPHTSDDSTNIISNKESVVRLPPISIPVFNGNYANWAPFKDLFVSLIHCCPTLDDVQRLHYLKTQLTGEAEQLIKHIPITKNNYNKCWELLQRRYDNKRFMSNCILKRLFGQRVMYSESAQGLKELLDTTSDCIHELSSLGVKVETWDLIIIYIVSLKLDTETRKEWELHVNSSGEDLPSFVTFKTFLESRFRALEFVEPTKNKSKPNQNQMHTKSLHTISTVTCPHCNENHRLYSCSKFAKQDVANRQEIVKSLNLCFNCFGNNHSGKVCRVATTCRLCRRKHHTLLHGKPHTVAVTSESKEKEHRQPNSSEETKETINISNHFVTGKVYNQTLLATALIQAESKNGYHQILRALLDQGSQASFISEAAVQLLRLNKIAANSTISGLGGGHSDLTSKYVVMVNIQSLNDPTFRLQVKAHVLKTVTSVLPDRKFVLPNWQELDNIHLADPQYNSPNKIDILLGSEIYCSILKEGLIRSPTGIIIAQDTYLGWVLSGQVDYDEAIQKCHNVIVNLHTKIEDTNLIKKFWEIESEPSSMKKILTPDEQACEDHFKATTYRNESGRYVVELPFRSGASREYGDTRAIAVKRLLSLEKRLTKNADLKQNYSKVLDEYLTLAHMEEVPNGVKHVNETVWLPHHAVVRVDKSTTPVRVVFNASSKSANGVSLNDTLMVGPTLQPELRHTIMRWRMHPICLTADIIKMYRQVKVSPKHIDSQRIVWRQGTDDTIRDYRLLTVTFGTSCAPYLAVKALQQLAIDEGHNYPYAASRVQSDFYMDDLLTGCQSEEEAIRVYEEMNGLLMKGGFMLQKWASNRIRLFEGKETGMDREIKEDDVTKVVGLTWNRRTDEFDYSVRLSFDSTTPVTKREVIAEICRLYDPLGWIAPCIITAKIFIQKLWITGLDWEDNLPADLMREWELYRELLSKLVSFHIPRWVQSTDNDVQIELHGFSDASNAAYAAVIYIRCVSKNGTISTHLVTAKTKVAPIKQISTPRLELCGALLVTKLLIEVSETIKIDKINVHAWTDSTVVLAWLSDHPSRWKTFIANRTSEILTLLDSSHWSYVQSKENPADCASRGVSPLELLENKLWKNGPEWLSNDRILYTKPQSICTKTDLESRQIKSHATVTIPDEGIEELYSRFSSLRRLQRVVARSRRVLYLKLKDPNERKSKLTLPYLTVVELQEALTCCLLQHQRHWFHEDVGNLLKHKKVINKSKLATLNPYIDKNQILRVGGRIENSYLPHNSKHPIIVSGESPLAKLIIADAHEKTLHGGQLMTCYYIRSRYWITNLKNLVRVHIHHCIPCVRNAAKIKTQLMGQLPSCRVVAQKPFLYSGVDYAGPINIRTSKGRGQKSHKGYISLFICMATRAVHIEVVSDLTSEGFLSAFKRFVARRGRCLHLWSDNGTNFVGAAKQLKVLLASERSSFPDEVASSLANNGTEWHFIPPHAPNFGGLWEAGIKSTKHHLRRVLGDSTLTYEELATVLSQIEACLNSRPLSQISTDSDDPVPLTPGHFLVGEPIVMAPGHNYEEVKLTNIRRWQITQRMVQHFWRRWSHEYLTSFFQRYKWKTKSPEMRIGDVVLVREDNLPPTKWLFGRIVDVHPGKDDITRVVTLRCKNSIIQRPTSKLCILPIHDDE